MIHFDNLIGEGLTDEIIIVIVADDSIFKGEHGGISQTELHTINFFPGQQ